jgi:hypothetical protein
MLIVPSLVIEGKGGQFVFMGGKELKKRRGR